MTIRHLKIFVAVAETGKMSTAAERMFISQPTVSQAIRELEEHYETLLFERLSKRLYITEAGRQLLLYARQVIEQFDFLEQKMLDANGKEHLKIGMTVTVGSSIMSDIVQRLEAECPFTETYTYINNTQAIEKMLLEAELNVGIVEGNVKSPDLISVPLVKDTLVLACAASHPLAGKRVVYAADLAGQRFVMRHEGSGTRQLLENFLEDQHIVIKDSMEVDCISIIREAILYNNCLAVVSSRLLEQQIRDHQINIFYNGSGEWNRTFKLVYHKDKIVTPSMKKIMDLLGEYEQPVFDKNCNIGLLEKNERKEGKE